jgi:hypothetical protein
MEKFTSIALVSSLLLAAICQGTPLRLDTPPEEWKAILQELSKDSPIKCQFEELRHNPFHRLPKRFNGRMWWNPNIGLCLYYEQPSELRINILEDGIFVGRPDEPSKPLPDNGQDEVLDLFTKLFNWDVKWLVATFAVDGDLENTGQWHLQFRPLESNVMQQLRRMELNGEGGLLNQISLYLRGGRKIEIHLSEQSRIFRLDDEDLLRAFPDRDG